MSYKDLKPGHKYRTAWNDRPGESSAPVTFIAIDQVFGEDDATITIEIYSRLYTATAYQMKEEVW